MSEGPGLAKVRSVVALLSKERRFVRTLEGSLRAWLEAADVVSEGALDVNRGSPRYFGSSSILLPWSAAPDASLRDARAAIALTSDPHLRVLSLRIARREAESRAPSGLATMRADLSCYPESRGFVIAVDVEADGIEIPRAMLRS